MDIFENTYIIQTNDKEMIHRDIVKNYITKRFYSKQQKYDSSFNHYEKLSDAYSTNILEHFDLFTELMKRTLDYRNIAHHASERKDPNFSKNIIEAVYQRIGIFKNIKFKMEENI